MHTVTRAYLHNPTGLGINLEFTFASFSAVLDGPYLRPDFLILSPAHDLLWFSTCQNIQHRKQELEGKGVLLVPGILYRVRTPQCDEVMDRPKAIYLQIVQISGHETIS